jgi:Lrp/AsnC family transcriptional regulator
MQIIQQNGAEFDQLDTAILAHLQEDSTISNADLAQKIGLSPSACLGRTKRLRQTGVIRGFVAIVDEHRVGLEVTTYVFVSLQPHDRETTELFLKSINDIPNVMECHNISGVHDYLLKIISPSIRAYRDFVIDTLIEVPGVGKVESTVVLSTEKLIYKLPM